jgi:4-diphosphocytidyl-2-C-methyl-D-erythritol kinase
MVIREAPAKVNLSLRVLRRREDGFHEIATRIAPLALADRLTVEPLPALSPGVVDFSCDDPSVPSDETNLAVKAVRALEKHTGPLPALRIRLEKRIPHGAGLGGGSSDAAAVLRAINDLFSLALPAQTLLAAAAGVGSDVPFFLADCVCDCTGRGEIVTPLSCFEWRPRILLVKPPFAVPTPGVYRRWQDSQEIPGLPYAPQETQGGTLVNDLERPAFEKYPVLGTLKARLLACTGVTAALMSGSGSTVFAVLEQDASVEPIIDAVQKEIGPEMWWCDTAVR